MQDIVILNIIKIRSFFAFDEKILENKAEKPIQILDYSQVLSYQDKLLCRSSYHFFSDFHVTVSDRNIIC